VTSFLPVRFFGTIAGAGSESVSAPQTITSTPSDQPSARADVSLTISNVSFVICLL